MKLIIKNPPPGSLTTYKTKIGAYYDEMDPLVREDVEDSLLNEQGYICGYCQQLIKEKSKMSVEHHCEQTICNGLNGSIDRRLDYTNFLAVCKGKAGKELHCDSQKSKFNSTNGLPITFSPWEPAHIAGLNYHSTGKLDSVNPIHSREIDTILALNTPHLKDQRKRIWKKIYSSSKDRNGNLSKEKLKRLTEKFINKAGNIYETAFPGLYEYMFYKFK